MEQLDNIYRKLLEIGLIAIRDAAAANDLARCKAEAELIHNLPSLIGESNLNRHLIHASTERAAYLEFVLATKRKELMEFVTISYLPYWKRLDKILEELQKAAEVEAGREEVERGEVERGRES